MSLPPGLISGLPMQISPDALAIQQLLQQQLAVQQLLRTQQIQPLSNPMVIPQVGGLPLSVPMMIPKLQNGPSRAPDGPPRRYQGSYEVKSFTYRSPHDGNGVVYSLGLDKKGGNWKNPVESRILRVCASSLSAGTLACTVDHDLNGVLFQSDDQPWSWCIFDFQECSIRPNYYTMAHRSMSHNFFIRSWQLEGSNDNLTWQILSRHNNDETITPNNLVGGWALHAKAFYRYLRIVLDPRGNSEGGSALLFNCFDVYGEFKYPSSGIPTPQSRPKDEKDRKRGGSRESSRERKRDRDSSERSRKKTFGGDDEMNNKDDDLRGVASVDLLTLRGQLMDHCLSQEGSRQVQARLSRGECTKEEMALLMEEISNSLLTLMENKFGNYVIQKLLEHGTTEYKTIITEVIRGNVLKLASQLFGCFVLQTALDVLDEDQSLLIAEELRDHVLQSVDHHHANHVLRKCIEVLPPAKCKFLLDPLVGNVTEVAQHVYGCRLLQVVLARFAENSHLIPKLIEELVEGCRQLARDTYGNYVIQHVLTYGDKYYKSNVFQSLLGRITDLLQHQSASHVIEKMYEHANKDERADILDKLLIEEASQLPMLMKDKHANHVFQRMIDFSNSDEKSKIKDAMSPHQDVLSEEPHGRYLLLRLQGKWQGNKNTQAEGWNNKQTTRGDNKRKRESNYEGYDPNEL